MRTERSSAFEVEEQPRRGTGMSEQGQPEGMHPHLQLQQNPRGQSTNEMVVDDSGALATYANFCRVTATPEEVILDFGLNPQPFSTGGQVVKTNQRIVMSFYTAKRLLSAIGMTIQRHEQTFDAIELDVSRRVWASRPQLAPPDRLASAGQPEVIKLF
jgi:hypothetical protein